ncbi:hypothetical protein PoB_002021500 [Plakobranchus ocellatus]|uniref:FHA domain-containing protein n=1 Tax=Plakobranchus ocellatus TaxID=259542 RepID=A0AAV3ZDL1_9GAST|nr:hypothetical protein PoB_002021500 [Plakobranchus ocellatus]
MKPLFSEIKIFPTNHPIHTKLSCNFNVSTNTTQVIRINNRDINNSTLSIRDIDNNTISIRDIDNSTLTTRDINNSTVSHNRDIKNINNVILNLHSVLKFHILSIPPTSYQLAQHSLLQRGDIGKSTLNAVFFN